MYTGKHAHLRPLQPMPGIEPCPDLAQELITFCRQLQSLSRRKVPRSIDFEAELPRLPTGKLYKRLLRDRYWGNKSSRIVRRRFAKTNTHRIPQYALDVCRCTRSGHSASRRLGRFSDSGRS